MTSTENFQLSVEAAEAYETKFVPTLFAEWAPRVVAAAEVSRGDSVLDVACGTGVVAREAIARAGREGHVIGLDLNEAMLTVAQRKAPSVDWRVGDACALPFADDTFDAVVCQAALMFFADARRALSEMGRVAKPGGRVAVQVWADLTSQPAYGPIVDVVARHAGRDAVELMGAYWRLGDLARLEELINDAGLHNTASNTATGIARFVSAEELVAIEVESTPLGERLDDAMYGAILTDIREALAPFHGKDGVAIPIVGHVVAARAD